MAEEWQQGEVMAPEVQRDPFELELEQIEAALETMPDKDGQLSLPGIKVGGLREDDPARESMVRALVVDGNGAERKRRGGRVKGSANLLTQTVKDDVARAWVALGGASFLVRAVASGDEQLRTWGLRMFERALATSNLTLAAQINAGSGASAPQFVMSVTGPADPMSEEVLENALRSLPVDRLGAIMEKALQRHEHEQYANGTEGDGGA